MNSTLSKVDLDEVDLATPEERDSEDGEEEVEEEEEEDEEEKAEEVEGEEEDGNNEDEEANNGRGDKVSFSPALGVKIQMEEEESDFLPVPGLFGKAAKSSTNPLIRLASRTSIKLLCGATGSKEEKEGGGSLGGSASGVTAPYYPIFLPIDQDFKAKYMWHHRMAKRGRSLKEKTYSFLEHPVGWFCFFYHMSV